VPASVVEELVELVQASRARGMETSTVETTLHTKPDLSRVTTMAHRSEWP
jgi:hypothetical protein